MNFISHQQLLDDVRIWSQTLPHDLVAVAGVPRSGLLPALHLSLHRNLHLITIEALIAGESPWTRQLRRGVSAKPSGRVLVVDDSFNSGKTLQAVRRQLSHRNDCLYGAVYGRPEPGNIANFTFCEIGMPRCFEWNLFHCDQMAFACLDMDGVLCADWTQHESDAGPDLDRYREHLAAAAPLHIPTYPVRAIVTSRLEKYRRETTAWLQRHGIRFRELIMSPHATAAARQRANDHAARKAAAYASIPDARLFIESDVGQAREIARRTKRAVICSTTMTKF